MKSFIIFVFQIVSKYQFINFLSMQQGDQNWMPLQSNAEVINPFIQKMGLKTDLYCFQQMLSTQQWALQMIPKPVLGVLMLYQITPVQTQHKNQQKEQLHPQNIPNNIFFMKQYAQNACGTIGLFHIIINALKNHPQIVVQNSYLDKFKNEGLNKNAQDRGKLFKQSKEILQQHKSASNEGQSQVQQHCQSHFISFIQRDGRLYEMDGFKICPVDHGTCQEEQLLSKSSEVIKRYMERDPDNIHFSMLVLAKTNPQ